MGKTVKVCLNELSRFNSLWPYLVDKDSGFYSVVGNCNGYFPGPWVNRAPIPDNCEGVARLEDRYFLVAGVGENLDTG